MFAQAFNYAPRTVYLLHDDFATRCYLELRFSSSSSYSLARGEISWSPHWWYCSAVGECRWCRVRVRKESKRIVAMSHVIQCCDCRLSHTHTHPSSAYYERAYLPFCRLRLATNYKVIYFVANSILITRANISTNLCSLACTNSSSCHSFCSS